MATIATGHVGDVLAAIVPPPLAHGRHRGRPPPYRGFDGGARCPNGPSCPPRRRSATGAAQAAPLVPAAPLPRAGGLVPPAARPRRAERG
jgi:hypothetical protein